MTRIIITDDHQIFVDGLKELLQGMEGIEVVGEANNGKALLELLETTPADLILLDVNMPEMNGIEATKALVEMHPSVRILMLTMFDTADYIQKLLRAGAHGYVLKNTDKNELQLAIQTLMRGESYFSAVVTTRIMEGLQKKKALAKDYQLVELTEREKEVLLLISNEMTTREIADKLCVSHHTVETHRKNLISKLQVRNVTGLVKYAVQQGWVE
jgi:DNA-binding NarL/FixJ family response regulator